MGLPLLELLFLAVLVVASGLLSAAEAAILITSKIKARELAAKGLPGSKELLWLRESPRATLTTIIVCNSVVTVVASALATTMGIRYFGSNGLGIATGVMTIVLLTFGEVIPKAVGAGHPTRISLALARPLAALHWLLSPVLSLFERLSAVASRAFGPERKTLVTEEEIKAVLAVGLEEKVIETDEHRLILAVMQFNQTPVKKVMTPSAGMVTLDPASSVDSALLTASIQQYSRFPLSKLGKSEITGIVHLKDMVRAQAEGNGDVKLSMIARKPITTLPDTPINQLFTELQRRKRHAAIVQDASGVVLGIVTTEDILEELVGEITDETELPRAGESKPVEPPRP